MLARLLFIASLLVSLNSYGQDSGSWAYQSESNDGNSEETLTLTQKDGYLAVNDLAYTASFCQHIVQYCFQSKVLSFAIPKEVGTKTNWEQDGVKYVLEKRMRLEHDGSHVPVMVVITQGDSSKTRFYFSKNMVLLLLVKMELDQS